MPDLGEEDLIPSRIPADQLGMRTLFFYILSFFASVFTNASGTLYAQEVLRWPESPRIAIHDAKQVTYILDKSGAFHQDPAQLLLQNWTQDSARGSLNMGYSAATLWVRFRLQTDPDRVPELVIAMKEATVNRVRLYEVANGKLMLKTQGGAALETWERSIHSLGLHLTWDSPPAGIHDFVLEVQTTGGILDGAFTLYSAREWISDRLTPTLIFQSVFYGMLLALMIFNALTWYLTRQRVHIYYVAYVGSVLAVLATYEGVLDWIRPWPEIGGWIHLAPTFSSCVGITLFLLLGNFYEAGTRFPRLARLFQGMIAIHGLAILFNVLGYPRFANQMVNFQIIPTTLIVVFSGWHAWREGFRPALYMLVARLVMLSFTLIILLKVYEILPSNTFTDYAFHIGTVIEMVIVYFGLAQRMKNLESEKVAAQHNERVATVRLDWFNTLVRVITHDMSTPISVISTSIDLELRREQPSPSLKRNLQRIQRAVNQQHDLVGHVREMIAVTTGKKTLHCVPTELQKKLDGLLLNFAERIEAKKVQVQLETPAVPLYVLAEPTALEHTILGNFLSNAIKFSQSGAIIRIQLLQEEDMAVIRFEDHGIGIPPELLGKLFDPTLATSRPGTAHENGTGFGLPIAQVYITQFRGFVRVQSTVARNPGDPSGTIFEIRLPLCAAEANAQETRISA